ncbi:YbaB/EbfC family nucleoid-associated protein [Lentzea sp. NPDC034063]|uniref:YbaB/EbfC family nucleoid-associated protein n=1 Tax=unclassified Lentzea TaxID=2643253 RepID=UPI0033E7F352
MDEPLLDPNGARERLAAWKGRVDKLAADTKAMGDRLQELRVVASDPGRMTEVTVDSTGQLVGLRLTDRIDRVTPDVVASTIMATLRAARRELAEKSQEVVAETVGTESAAAQAISASIAKHLRTEPGPRTAPSPPPGSVPVLPAARSRRPPPLPDDEDDSPSVIDDRW